MWRWGFNFPQLTDTTNLLFVTRRAAGKTNGLLLGGIIAGVAVLTLAGAWFLGGFSDSFPESTRLMLQPMPSPLSHSKEALTSLRG